MGIIIKPIVTEKQTAITEKMDIPNQVLSMANNQLLRRLS